MVFLFKKNTLKTAIAFLLLWLFGCISISVKAQSDTLSGFIEVKSILITGNNKTEQYIIYRELLFAEGEKCIESEFIKKINQSRLNLLNTSLFNFVEIDTTSGKSNNGEKVVDVKISLLERWYVWPVPIAQLTDRNFNAWWRDRNFTRINYGLDVQWYNFSGRMDELDATVQFGKNRHFSLAYQNPYVDHRKRIGFGFEGGYMKNRELGYATINDKLQFAFVPEGLSSEAYMAISGTYRNNIFTTHQIIVGFHSYEFTDSLLRLNPDYSYPGKASPTFLNIYYKLKMDHRDLKYYPLKGWYADIELNKSGAGLGFESPVNSLWIKTTTRIYMQMANRWYSGASIIGKLSSKPIQPYFLLQGLGYGRDYVRGYQYNVIDGKHFALFRSNIKFALIPEQTYHVRFIPTPKFSQVHYALYLTAFADAGYVWHPQWIGLQSNKLPETFLAGAGFGIDFVTYYDKVVRVEYSVNKSGESGIFIHFIAGI